MNNNCTDIIPPSGGTPRTPTLGPIEIIAARFAQSGQGVSGILTISVEDVFAAQEQVAII